MNGAVIFVAPYVIVYAIHRRERCFKPISIFYLIISRYKPVQFGGVMVACHDYELQTYQNSAFSDRTFKQTRNPIKRNGETASIIEEGKIHLDLSLVVEVHVQDDRVFEALTDKTSQASQDFLQTCKNLLWQQRIAGGSVLEIGNVQLFNLEEIKIFHWH